MRRTALLIALLVMLTPRPGRADDSVEVFLKAMGIGMLSPLVATVLVSPLHIAAWARGTKVEPRPTSGSGRLETTMPWRDDAIVLAHLDLGGYPGPDARIGWESRSDLLALREPAREDGLQVRWDGLALVDLVSSASNWSLEALVGGTVWPTLGGAHGWEWNGGVVTGLRTGTWTGGRLFGVDAEALQLLVLGQGVSGVERQIHLRTGVSVRLPRIGPKRDRTPTSRVGVSYLGLFPPRASALLDRADLLVVTATF